MAMTREQITLILLSFEEELPQMRRQLPDESDFLPWIARQANYILDGVGPDHYEFAQTRINQLLGSTAQASLDGLRSSG